MLEKKKNSTDRNQWSRRNPSLRGNKREKEVNSDQDFSLADLMMVNSIKN